MIIKGHDVEKESQMVDAMQPLRVEVAYLALTVAPATEGKQAQIVLPVPCLRPGQISRDCTIILGLQFAKSSDNI